MIPYNYQIVFIEFFLIFLEILSLTLSKKKLITPVCDLDEIIYQTGHVPVQASL